MSKTSTFGHSVLQGDSRFVLTHDDRRWPVLAAGVFWLAAGLSAGYWVLHALGGSDLVPVTAAPAVLPVADPVAVARALGQSDPVAMADAGGHPAMVSLRYSLLGVVADRREQGAALIAIGDEPPRPYAVGASLEGGLVLLSVDRLMAKLGPSLGGPATIELRVPDLPEPSSDGDPDDDGDTPPARPARATSPAPVYTPPPAPASGVSPDLVPALPSVRGGDGTTVLPAERPPGS
ncbi:MAG: hypothetical protein R3E94_10095 [Burkholderiaceae bacterium]